MYYAGLSELGMGGRKLILFKPGGGTCYVNRITSFPQGFSDLPTAMLCCGGPPGSTPNVASCVFLDDTLRNWTVTFIFPRFKYLSALIFRVLIQTVTTY